MGVFQKLNDPIVSYSKCKNVPIFNENGKRLGKLQDFFIDFEETFPTVIAIQFKSRNEFYFSNWINIKEFNYDRIILKNSARLRRGKTYPKIPKQKTVKSLLKVNEDAEVVDYPAIGSIVINKQVVDTHGKKVVRIFDIHFIKIGRLLRVTHADTNPQLKGGMYNLRAKISKIFGQKQPLETKIPWKYVHKLGNKKTSEDIELNVSSEELESLHPADIADILEDLNDYSRKKLFQSLDVDIAADALVEIEDEEIKSEMIRESAPETMVEILEELESDEAVDIISELDPKEAQSVLSQMKDKKSAEDIKELMKFSPDSAGGMMTTETLKVSGETRKNDIISEIQKNHEEYQNIYDIYVIDHNQKLVGTCSLKTLIINHENLMIKDIIEDDEEDIHYCLTNDSWREVSEKMDKYNLLNIAVCDSNQKVLGHISIDDIVTRLNKELD